jgi:beta-galactosidase beta subunit
MITGKLEDLKDFIEINTFNTIMAFISEVRSGKAEINKWHCFDENQFLKAVPLNKSNKQDDVKEYHKIYTDIHITLSGVDTIFIGNRIDEIVEEYQELSDYSLVKALSVSSKKIFPNHFAIIKSKVLHCNVLEDQDPLKVVIKIKEKCQK